MHANAVTGSDGLTELTASRPEGLKRSEQKPRFLLADYGAMSAQSAAGAFELNSIIYRPR